MPYLSASAMVIHYEEALYQVYAPFTLYLTPTYSYLYLPSCTCFQRLQVWVQDGRMSQWPMHYNQFCHRWIIWKTLSLDWGIACQYANHWESNKFRFQGMLQHIVVDMPVSDCFGEAVRNWHGSSSKETEALSTVLISEFKWQELCQCRWTSISRQTMVTLTAAVICIFDLLLKPVLRVQHPVNLLSVFSATVLVMTPHCAKRLTRLWRHLYFLRAMLVFKCYALTGSVPECTCQVLPVPVK